MIFDSHAHYDSRQFDEDRDEVLSSLKDKNVSLVLNAGCDIESSKMAIELAEKYDFLYAAAGVHPGHIEAAKDGYIDELKELSKHEKCVAIGEIGLDYYYGKDEKERQKVVFDEQLSLAESLGLPVVIHEREAYADAISILKKHNVKGVMHAFSGNKVTLKEVLDLGLYIGVGGMLTFKNNVKTVEMCPHIPLDRLLIETDTPYLAPVPVRGKRNDSANLIYVAEKIAELMGITKEEVLEASLENAKRLFSIK